MTIENMHDDVIPNRWAWLGRRAVGVFVIVWLLGIIPAWRSGLTLGYRDDGTPMNLVWVWLLSIVLVPIALVALAIIGIVILQVCAWAFSGQIAEREKSLKDKNLELQARIVELEADLGIGEE